MSRGPQVTQAEFDYLKVLQKRKVGHIEAAVQTGRNVKTTREVYKAGTLAEYQSNNRRDRPAKQQVLPIKVEQREAEQPRTMAEMQQAIQNLSDLYWQQQARIDQLYKRQRSGDKPGKPRFWEV